MTDTTNINSTIYNIIMGDRYLDGPLNLLPGKIIKLQKKKKTGLLQTTALAIGIIIIFFLVGYILMQEFLIRIVLFHS